MNSPFYKKPDQMDCAATCLRMVAKHYCRSISLPKLRQLTETTREGASLKRLAKASETIGFRTLGVKVTFDELGKDIKSHFCQ
jgi:ATP-binding cassette subfamily B protein